MTPPPLVYDSSNMYVHKTELKVSWEWTTGTVCFTHKFFMWQNCQY